MKIAPINLTNKFQNFTTPNFKKNPINLNNQTVKKALFIPTVAFLAMITAPKINAQTNNKEESTNIETIQHSEDIRLFGKDYTLVYTDGGFSNIIDKKIVADIYFVPQNDRDRTLKLEHLSYQKEGEFETITAIVSDFNKPDTPQQAPREIKLPIQVGKKLLSLYQGNSEFFLIPGSDTYSEK